MVGQLASLPETIRKILIDESTAQINDKISRDFKLSADQEAYFFRSILNIVLKKSGTLHLAQSLSNIPGGNAIDIQKLALRIACDRLWPLQDYLGNVDTLIKQLGGTVPPRIPLPAAAEEEEGADTGAQLIQGHAKDILREHREFNDLYLTQKPIRDPDSRLKAPSVANWLQDYLHTMGAEGSSTLKRSQYLVKSKNALILNDAEKANVLNFLISYDEGYPMYWRVAEEHYLLVEPELPGEVRADRRKKQGAQALDELIATYKSLAAEYQELLEKQKKLLEAQAHTSVRPLPDIFWDALGFGQIESCLAVLSLMIERGIFLDVLKTDQRLRGIVLRAVTARYGMEAKNFWNGDMTAAPVLAIFWHLVLLEKLKLEETRASVLADVFTKKLGLGSSPMYLDLQSGSFRFREVKWEKRAFQLV